jgi:hypothetical protein
VIAIGSRLPEMRSFSFSTLWKSLWKPSFRWLKRSIHSNVKYFHSSLHLAIAVVLVLENSLITLFSEPPAAEEERRRRLVDERPPFYDDETTRSVDHRVLAPISYVRPIEDQVFGISAELLNRDPAFGAGGVRTCPRGGRPERMPCRSDPIRSRNLRWKLSHDHIAST